MVAAKLPTWEPLAPKSAALLLPSPQRGTSTRGAELPLVARGGQPPLADKAGGLGTNTTSVSVLGSYWGGVDPKGTTVNQDIFVTPSCSESIHLLSDPKDQGKRAKMKKKQRIKIANPLELFLSLEEMYRGFIPEEFDEKLTDEEEGIWTCEGVDVPDIITKAYKGDLDPIRHVLNVSDCHLAETVGDSFPDLKMLWYFYLLGDVIACSWDNTVSYPDIMICGSVHIKTKTEL